MFKPGLCPGFFLEEVKEMPEQKDVLIEVGDARGLPGYWRGLRQPVFLIPMYLMKDQVLNSVLRTYDQIISAVLSEVEPDVAALIVKQDISQNPVVTRVSVLALAFLSTLKMPIMNGAKAFPLQSDRGRPCWVVAVSAISKDISTPAKAFYLSCDLLNELIGTQAVNNQDISRRINSFFKDQQSFAPKGENTLRLLQAADELNIPWMHMTYNVYQIGWGRNSRWFDSTFTDRTSTIGAALARDKFAGATVLRKAGLPTPKHTLVYDLNQALQAAQNIGYPVVIKPSNLDGGYGVFTKLTDANAVRRAFLSANQHSKQVLVEEFVEGKDYRVRVCNGKAIGVMIRKPAYIVGDGVNTVAKLIEILNQARLQKQVVVDPTIERGSKPIQIDDELYRWLTMQNLSLESVVSTGREVRLKGAANVSLGGTTWDVTASAHPDNLELAVSAVMALRLDVAGVDLILPDIKNSYKVTGGSICEVNAQPQYSTAQAYTQLLKLLVPNKGRIPIVLIVGLTEPISIMQSLIGGQHGSDVSVVWADDFYGCQRALVDARTDALVFAPLPANLTRDYFAFDFVDLYITIDQDLVDGISTVTSRSERWSIQLKSSEYADLPKRLGTWLSTRISERAVIMTETFSP